MKKNLIIVFSILVLTVLLGIGTFTFKTHMDKKNQSGILLAFDDYAVEDWEGIFDLLDEHDVKVTFFINAFGPTEFCEKAKARGHEIGFHTIGHMNVKDLEEKYIIEQAIDPIQEFHKQGYELTAFAYPYGSYSPATNELLLKHYKVLRGAYYHELREKDSVNGSFIESLSIDNVNYPSDEEFKNEMMSILLEAYENPGTVVSFYSHSINDWAEWAISVERLEFLFETAQNLGLKFYTYSDLLP